MTEYTKSTDLSKYPSIPFQRRMYFNYSQLSSTPPSRYYCYM